jgi:hypothetical protein
MEQTTVTFGETRYKANGQAHSNSDNNDSNCSKHSIANLKLYVQYGNVMAP